MKKQKVQVFSDIHMEAYHDVSMLWKFVTPKAPIAVVAGDIHSRKFEETVSEIATKFKHVVCVAGNHEWYRRDISWRPDPAQMPANVHFLNPGVCEINDIVFIGATLWTDFNKGEHYLMHAARTSINDFRVIRSHNYEQPFTPQMAWDKHIKEKQYIKMMLEKYKQYDDKKIVVVTHFMPTYEVVHPKWKNYRDDLLNRYFSASCDDLIEYSEADAWVFGHTHDYRDMKVRGVRMVCNPLGYPGENGNKFKDKVILV